MRYRLKGIHKSTFFAEAQKSYPPTIWRWHALLPEIATPVTLSEGNTPLVQVGKLGEMTGIPHLYVKLEAANPSGSFKDRLNSVAMSMARRFGFTHTTIVSTGNQGVSVATYAAVAGMKCVIFCPPQAEARTIRELLLRGVCAIRLTEDGSKALGLVDELVRKHGWYVSARNFPRPFANPFGLEGYKTIAFEIVEQAGEVPDAVLVPTGGGDSIYGIWKGFRELREAGVIEVAPRMFACQSLPGGPSIVEAVERGSDRAASVPSSETIAVSITTTRSGDHGVWAVRESNGGAVAVTDEEIITALSILGPSGIAVCPSSAVAVAGLLRLAAAGSLRGARTVVCICTATAMRWSNSYRHLEDQAEAVPRIRPDIASLRGVAPLL
jgi:threonine synthase